MNDTLEEQKAEEIEQEEENIARAYRLLFWGLIFESIAAIITFFVILPAYIGGFSLYLFLAFIAIWLKKSFYIVDGNEMAVKVIVGVAVGRVDSGFQLIPWFWGCSLVIYPKKTYSLDYRKRTVITKKGVWPATGKDKTEYGKQVIELDSTAYISFPRDDNLIQVYKNHIPIEEEKLKDWTEEAVVSSLRAAFGNKTWGEATEKFEKTREKADENFRRTDGPMIQVGFRESGIRLAVEEIFLPSSIEKSLADVDRARLEKEASVYYADEEAEKTVGSIMEMMKKETGMTRKQIEKELKKNPDQFIKDHKGLWEKSWDLLHRNMAIKGGSFVDVRVGGANLGGIEKGILEFLGVKARMPQGRRMEDNRSSKHERNPISEYAKENPIQKSKYLK